MNQLSLFASRERVLIDDPRGRITYHSGCIDAACADAWFAQLRDDVAWEHERRVMYEREVDVPRLTAQFDLDDARLPPALQAAAQLVTRLTGARFNSVGLNFYRNEHDSVAPHNDKLHSLVVGAPIAIVSLGAMRRMTIREKQPPRRRLQLDLEHGSVLVMSYATQLHFDHGIAKQRTPVAGRISAAFRERPL